jgi:Protein of unknown function (DUF1616)
MPRHFRELAVPILAACCGAAVLVLHAGSPARLIAGIALVLILPGLAIERALLPLDERGPERFVVALGASAAIVVLAAIILDLAGLPLEVDVWAPVLVTVTVVASAVGYVRHLYLPRPRSQLVPPGPAGALLIALALALISGALVLGTTPLSAPGGTPGYTALWIQTNAARGAAAVARSGQLHSVRYELSVSVDGRPVVASPSFTLAPGEEYRTRVPPPLRSGARVTALLYRVDNGARRLSRRADATVGRTVPQPSGPNRS